MIFEELCEQLTEAEESQDKYLFKKMLSTLKNLSVAQAATNF